MKITESAVQVILSVMRKKGLDPRSVYLEIGIFEKNFGMGFTKEKMGRIHTFGELNVLVGYNVESDQLVVDYGEVDGRKGLVFLGELEWESS